MKPRREKSDFADKDTPLGFHLGRTIVTKHNGILTVRNRPKGGGARVVLLPELPA